MFTLSKKSQGWLLFTFLWGQVVAQAAELEVLQPYESGRWQLNESAFECRLSQEVDGVAKVSFIREAGFPISLQLQLLNTEQTLNYADVSLRKADWQSDAVPFGLSTIESAKIKRFNAVFASDAGKFISMLPHGYWLDFRLSIGDSLVTLTVPSIQANIALKEYEKCKMAMSPLSWEQARDYEIEFASAEQVVKSEEVLLHLHNLVRYIQLDKQVSKVLIDGHTDDVGNSAANRALSQTRADEVASRLREFGLNPKLLEVRAHGSRYPIVNNQSIAKGQNRRVTVRLISEGKGL